MRFQYRSISNRLGYRTGHIRFLYCTAYESVPDYCSVLVKILIACIILRLSLTSIPHAKHFCQPKFTFTSRSTMPPKETNKIMDL
jgi:hypothetical protein